MSSSKKIDLVRDFAAGVYLSEAQNPIPPAPCARIRVYSIPFHTGKGGVEPERRLEGQHYNSLQIPKFPVYKL